MNMEILSFTTLLLSLYNYTSDKEKDTNEEISRGKHYY